jgi:hypothetical protein
MVKMLARLHLRRLRDLSAPSPANEPAVDPYHWHLLQAQPFTPLLLTSTSFITLCRLLP